MKISRASKYGLVAAGVAVSIAALTGTGGAIALAI